MYKNRDGIVEVLDLEALSKLELNDFNGMEKLLFTDDELENPNRWEKFWEPDEDIGERYWNIAIPFTFDDIRKYNHAQVVYQINHYVLWMTIGYLCCELKPLDFVAYNTGHRTPNPISECYACEYATHLSGEWFCDSCPIWKNDSVSEGSLCCSYEIAINSGKSAFNDWSDAEGDDDLACMKRRFAAQELAQYPWFEKKELAFLIKFII